MSGTPTWLGHLNWWLLQWFFIRLAAVIDDDTGHRIGWTIIVRKPLAGWIK